MPRVSPRAMAHATSCAGSASGNSTATCPPFSTPWISRRSMEINTWFIAKAAKEAGLKVALSGIGGDELLAGYPSFIDVPRWRRRFGALAKVPGFGALARTLVHALAPQLARRQPKAAGLFEYSGSWAGAYLLRRGLFLPHELDAVLDPDVAREGLRRLDPIRGLAASITPDPCTDVGRLCALESSHYLRNQLLRDADWAGMAHSLEIRVPLVDVKLLTDFAPTLAALTPGQGKAALAHVAVRCRFPTRSLLAPRPASVCRPAIGWRRASRGKPQRRAAPRRRD